MGRRAAPKHTVDFCASPISGRGGTSKSSGSCTNSKLRIIELNPLISKMR